MALIYLAGPIEGLSYDLSTGWRDHCRMRLEDWGHQVLSPMRNKEELRGINEISRGSREKLGLVDGKFTDKATIGRDMTDVRRCDGILMNLMGSFSRSIGTMVELGWASAWDKPVVLVYWHDGTALQGTYNNHPFIREIPIYRTDDLDDALRFLHWIFPPAK